MVKDIQPTQVVSFRREAPLQASVALGEGPPFGSSMVAGRGRCSGSGRPGGRKGVWSWLRESVHTA
eukprot:5064726-Pleurochrysis_carterae.AAC.1